MRLIFNVISSVIYLFPIEVTRNLLVWLFWTTCSFASNYNFNESLVQLASNKCLLFINIASSAVLRGESLLSVVTEINVYYQLHRMEKGLVFGIVLYLCYNKLALGADVQ